MKPGFSSMNPGPPGPWAGPRRVSPTGVSRNFTAHAPKARGPTSSLSRDDRRVGPANRPRVQVSLSDTSRHEIHAADRDFQRALVDALLDRRDLLCIQRHRQRQLRDRALDRNAPRLLLSHGPFLLRPPPTNQRRGLANPTTHHNSIKDRTGRFREMSSRTPRAFLQTQEPRDRSEQSAGLARARGSRWSDDQRRIRSRHELDVDSPIDLLIAGEHEIVPPQQERQRSLEQLVCEPTTGARVATGAERKVLELRRSRRVPARWQEPIRLWKPLRISMDEKWTQNNLAARGQ